MYHDRKKKTALRHLKMHHFTPILKKNSRGGLAPTPLVYSGASRPRLPRFALAIQTHYYPPHPQKFDPRAATVSDIPQ